MNRLLCLLLLIASCPIHSQNLSFSQQDPFEKINRNTNDFNLAFDATCLRPPARLYQAVIPAPVRAGINNMFTNVHLITSMANDLLQGDWSYTVKDFWRFFINSSIGVAGFFDVAANPKTFNLPPHTNDLGLTFAKWGNPTSPYLVLPFLGPSTIRDGISIAFDYAIFSPYPFMTAVYFYPVFGIRYVDLRSQLSDQEALLKQSLDQYTFIRNAYLQHRQYVITGEQPNMGALYIDEDNVLPVLKKNSQTVNATQTSPKPTKPSST
jgi:phospholipid-binding lipoprotein MlaA